MDAYSGLSAPSLAAALPFDTLPLCHRAHLQDIIPFDPSAVLNDPLAASNVPDTMIATVRKHSLSRRPRCSMPGCPEPSMATHNQCYYCDECKIYTCITCTAEQNEVFKLLVMIEEREEIINEKRLTFAHIGTIHKKGMGKMYRPWAKRSFSLNLDHTLSYFNGSAHRGLINVRGCSVRVLLPREAEGRHHAFLVEAPLVLRSKTWLFRSRDLVLAAESAEESADWCAALNVAIRSAADNLMGAIPDRGSSQVRRSSTNAAVAGSFSVPSTLPPVGMAKSNSGLTTEALEEEELAPVNTITNNAGTSVPDAVYTSAGVTAAMIIRAYRKRGLGIARIRGSSSSTSGPQSFKRSFGGPSESAWSGQRTDGHSVAGTASESVALQEVGDDGMKVPPELRTVFIGLKVQKKTVKENIYRTRYIWMDGMAQTFNWSKRMDKSGEHKSAAITSFSECVIDLPIIAPMFTSRDKLQGFCVRLIHRGRSSVASSGAASGPQDAAAAASDDDIDLRFEMKEHARCFVDAFYLMAKNSTKSG